MNDTETMPVCASVVGEPMGELDISAARAALSRGEISALSVAEACIAARERVESELHVYQQVDDAGLLSAARELDLSVHRHEQLALAGLPFSVKSAIAVDGFDLYAGCAQPLPAGLMAQGPVVSALRDNGALVSGLTEAAELSVGGLGLCPHRSTPRNPWDASAYRVPGGSSAGAGISVLTGSCFFALGTDTGGSVRVPASFAGVVGLKTSSGLWPVEGVLPLASFFDTLGLFTRRVADLRHVFQVLDGVFGSAEAGLQTAPSRDQIRLIRAGADVWENTENNIAEVVEAALSKLIGAGYREPCDDEGLFERTSKLRQQGPNTAAYETRLMLLSRMPQVYSQLSNHVREFLDSGSQVSEADYRKRLEALLAHRRGVNQQIGTTDIIVLPTVKYSSPTLQTLSDRQQEVHYSDSVLHNTVLPSMCNLCAITLPVGLDSLGLPVGLQLAAAAGNEAFLLAVAEDVENILGDARQCLGVAPLLR